MIIEKYYSIIFDFFYINVTGSIQIFKKFLFLN